jgi:hypothetical protein
MVRRRSGGAASAYEEEGKRPAASPHGGRDKKKYKGEGSERDANSDAAGVDAPRERRAQSQEHDSCVPGAPFYLLKTDHLLFFLDKCGVLCTASTIESNSRFLRSLVGLGL